MVAAGTTQKQEQDHKLVNIPTIKKQCDIIEAPIINLQERNRRTTEENTTPVKQKLSHNTETSKSFKQIHYKNIQRQFYKRSRSIK